MLGGGAKCRLVSLCKNKVQVYSVIILQSNILPIILNSVDSILNTPRTIVSALGIHESC